MKDVISVDTIFNNLKNAHKDGIYTGFAENEAVKALHSLLISKLPEKKEVELSVPEEWTIGYNLCLEEMRKSIDEMFGVGDE